MTRATRPVRRLTDCVVRGREIVVTLDAHCITVRELGRRASFAVPIRAVYEAAMKLEARRVREEKNARKR